MIQEKSYSSFKKAIWFLLATISFFTAIAIDRRDNKTQLTPAVQQKIQVSFLNQINALEKQVDKVLNGQIQKEVKNLPTNPPFFLHIFQNNELVYWNTNQLPTSSNLSNNEIKNGVYKLSNGYYYIYSGIKNELIIQGSLLLQSSYELENEYLQNVFNPAIYDGVCPITITKKSPYSIRDKKGRTAFFISSTNQSNPFTDHSNITFIFLIFSFISFLLGLYFITRGHHYLALISFFALIIIRYLAIYYIPINLFSNQEYQSASLFPFNTLFPTILGLTLNIGILIYGFFIIVNIVNSRKHKSWISLYLVFLFILWWLILDFIKILV